MNRIIKSNLIVAIALAFVTTLFLITTPAQRLHSPPSWDTSKNPHDFTDQYYAEHGVNADMIKWRRTGNDGLSVFGKTIDPKQSIVRVIVTVPNYTESDKLSYWYPLGELTYSGFMPDKRGILAQEIAKRFPMYIFPDLKYVYYNTIVATRQAPIIDNTYSWTMGIRDPNPLGLREVFLVYYTEKCHTPEGAKIMEYMAQKNGVGTDKMPIINSPADIKMLNDEGYVILDTQSDGPARGHYAIAPVIADPSNGVIAKDAFLFMSSRDGAPLAAEMVFVDQFRCLQLKGVWCQ